MKATHIEHNFDRKNGWYEENSQNAGYLNGHSVILEKEDQSVFKKKSCDGLWDGIPFEIAGAETATSNNIRNALKHCACKPDTKIAVIYFPNDNFSISEFYEGIAKYDGLKGTSQFKKFDVIYCIHKKNIIHIKKPSD